MRILGIETSCDDTGAAVLDALRRHAGRADVWLDIGAGAGRYALPLARTVARVIAVDSSPAMLGTLREAMDLHVRRARQVDGARAVDHRLADLLAGAAAVPARGRWL